VRLISLRVLARLSQTELADATGFSQSLISILEGGAHEPRQDTWERLFVFLNSAVTLDVKPDCQRGKRKGRAPA
jgi:predicted transcriptional regulator